MITLNTYRTRMPNLFLLTLSDRDEFETDYMEISVKTARHPRSVNAVKIGDAYALVRTVAANDMVIALLGAECVDEMGHVMQLAGAREAMALHRHSILNRGVEVAIVVAVHEFKVQQDLYAAAADLDDRLDRVALYPGDDVDLILAGSRVFWREDSLRPGEH